MLAPNQHAVIAAGAQLARSTTSEQPIGSVGGGDTNDDCEAIDGCHSRDITRDQYEGWLCPHSSLSPDASHLLLQLESSVIDN